MKTFRIFSFITIAVICAITTSCGYMSSIWKGPLHYKNEKVLRNYVSKFDARGGGYIIVDATTGKEIDREFITYNDEPLPLVPDNISRLFTYAVGLNTGKIKENEIVFNSKDYAIFDKVSKDKKQAFLKTLDVADKNSMGNLLKAYVKLFNNSDNYLTEAQLDILKTAVFNNVKKGPAKNANVEGANVSGLAVTRYKNRNTNIVLASFVGQFEINERKYALITIIDEPMPKQSTYGFNSSGWNAVPLARDIIGNMMIKEK